MITKVYKVVKATRYGGHSPFMYRDGFRKNYRVGRKIFPAKGTKLFAFKSLEDARKYAALYSNTKIYECKAKNFSEGFWISEDESATLAFYSRAKFEDFLEKSGLSSLSLASSGICDSIKPIKKINIL